MKRVLLLAFVALALPAHAIKKPDLSGFRIAGGGTSVSVGPNQSGIAGSIAPVRTGGGATGTIPPGHVGSQIGNSGWYVGTAPAGSGTGTTAHLGHAGDVFFAGTKYPFQAGYKVEASALVDALGVLCKNPALCVGLSLTAPLLTQWLQGIGVRPNPDGANDPSHPFVRDTELGIEYRAQVNGLWSVWTNQGPMHACRLAAALAYPTGGQYSLTVHDYDTSAKQCKALLAEEKPVYRVINPDFLIIVSQRGDSNVQALPSSMDDIAPYLTPRPFPPGVVTELLDQGADINLPSKPSVTGPSQIKGPVTTTQNSDGTTTTRQTVSNFQINGNTITNTSNVTITNTCTGEGSCSTSTETTSPDPNADPDEQQDDSAVDSPMPTIPKLYERQYPDGIVGIWNAKSQQLKETQLASFVSTLMPTGFVAGTCPSWTFDLNIAQWADMGVHVVEPPCWLWGVAKTLVIISALMLARSLIFGG